MLSCKTLATSLVLALLLDAAGLAQNYERYKPLEPTRPFPDLPDIDPKRELPEEVEDDRVLVDALEAVVFIDHTDKIDTSAAIDDLDGVFTNIDASDSLVFNNQVHAAVQDYLGKPITLRSINELSRDIVKVYRKCKRPIVDVLIPEQRVTTGTLHVVIIESRIGQVRVQEGCYFDAKGVSKWIACTKPGRVIYEPWIENDLFWMNQNPFRRVSVDFEKGAEPGTTDVIYKTEDMRPLRGYVGVDDSGVETLNYGRFFAGAQYGNFLKSGGTLGYQYTSDQSFSLLHAHSVSWSQPIDRNYSFNAYGSHATVSPMIGAGLTQDGLSWQVGSGLSRHLIRNRTQRRNLSLGFDFKSTNNNLEFDGTNISNSIADLLALRVGFDDLVRHDIDQYQLFRWDVFLGPGGGLTGAHSTEAFETLRPGTSPDFVYTRVRAEQQKVLACHWMFASRFSGQLSSERLLFSETLGIGGFDTVRGVDQRQINADHGWVANLEFGPKPFRRGQGDHHSTQRTYGFVDFGNGYLAEPLAGEDAYTFVVTIGAGARFQLSDRFIARFDYGSVLRGMDGANRDARAHIGLTWIPGKRL